MTNDLVALAQFVGLALLVVVVARLGKTALYVLSTAFILLSNITVSVPVRVFGTEFSLAVVIYSMVYFIADLMSEYHGKYSAYRLAATNLLVQVLLWAYVRTSLAMEPTDDGLRSYGIVAALYGTSARITVAALVAAVGPFIDVRVFWYFKSSWKDDPTRAFWRRSLSLIVRNKLSTLVGQLINTVFFFTIAFVDTGITARSVGAIIISAFVVKTIVAVCDVPFLLLFARHQHRRPAETAASA